MSGIRFYCLGYKKSAIKIQVIKKVVILRHILDLIQGRIKQIKQAEGGKEIGKNTNPVRTGYIQNIYKVIKSASYA